MASPLRDLSVLVTRPGRPGERLASAINAAGGRAMLVPVLAIEPIEPPRVLKATLSEADAYIFVSRHAAQFGAALLDAWQISCSERAIFAVGAGTASELTRLGRQFGTVNYPPNGSNSEALLAIDALQARRVAGQRMVIFRGVGGREHLAEALSERGAHLTYCECYRRQPSPEALAPALKKYKISCPDAGIVTSLEGLNALREKILTEQLPALWSMPLVVPGQRIAREVAALGFTRTPLVVENPSDDSIINRLSKWVDENHD